MGTDGYPRRRRAVRAGLITTTGRLLAQHFPESDGRCRVCRVGDCPIACQATAYLESILLPAIPGPPSTAAILTQAATTTPAGRCRST